MLARIVGQIASPVRWDLCLETMTDLGVTGILEMPPAGTLTGIAKRALKGVDTFALKTPDQLDDARAFCARHGEGSVIESTPTWRMVVSPGKGTFHRAESAAGAETFEPGAVIGEVASTRDSTDDHRRPRRPGGRVAGRGRRPGLPRSTPAPTPPRGRSLMGIQESHRRPAHRDPRHRLLPAVPRGPELRDRRPHRLQRRVDPAALGHQAAPVRHRRGDRPADVGRGLPRRARARRHRRPPDRPGHRRHRHPPAPDPGHRDRDRLRARHRPGRGVRHLGRLRGLLPRRGHGQRPGPRRQRRATPWSSASSGSPTSPTSATAARRSSSPTAPAPR